MNYLQHIERYLFSYNYSAYNLESLGADEEHNTLWITGLSGSGKSTLAYDLVPINQVISLDTYSEWNMFYGRNVNFNSFLNLTVKDWIKVPNAINSFRFTHKYFEIVDDIRIAIIEYSKQLFYKNKILIVEGIQIADNWLCPDYDYLIGQPIIILKTPIKTCMKRVYKRDKLKPIYFEDKQNYENFRKMWSNLNNLNQFMQDNC